MKLGASAVIGLLASTVAVDAHIGRALTVSQDAAHLHGQAKRGHHFERRAKINNAADLAKLSDSTQECAGYDYPSSKALSGKYPGHGIAKIVDGDDEASKVWSEIQKSGIIPDGVQPKGAAPDHYGISDQASNSYDLNKDPDCWWTTTGCTKPKHDNIGNDLTACPEPNTWGLTFDDGPNCTHNAFYDYLSQQKLKATLFYIGTNVKALPYQAQRGLADGHDVCVHTWAHRYMTTLTNEQVFAELYYTMRIIKDVTGITTRCWRPPFGDVDDRVRAIAAGLGLRTIIWSDDTDDWNIIPDGDLSTGKIDSNYQSIIDKQTQNKLKGEGVNVLTHELTLNTMGEFQKEFPKIKKAFANIVPLTACFNVTHPYVEDSYKYPVFSDFILGTIQPQGLPSLDKMPSIQVGSQMNIVPEKQQTGKGGFSSSSKKSSGSSSNSASSSDNASSSSSSASSSSDDSSQSSSGDSSSSSAAGSSDLTGSDVSANNNEKANKSSASSVSFSLLLLSVPALLSFTLASL
ncbi:hypothetical protein MYAM1_002903 [Malassezia yamatoensis]|uniref:chitin deacetylase n=1 Tax=Malassezia yamatoensis TaxID=253288 RepID=A0AAJ5YU05_9BASI|nr:hypothetical protein MYAM1_002903 [Malassezia yamatoensis]